jgi:bifunctional ADP-heptose synthase (sugar kinase/adenylyltransferase)
MFKILLAGDACDDIYHYGVVDRLSQEAPVPILKHLYTETRKGMCLNVEANLVAHGNQVCVITNKKFIRKERFVDIKTKQHLLRADFGENNALGPMPEDVINEINFNGFDALVISDYEKGFISYDVAKRITTLARNSNIPVFVDSKKHDLSCYEDCIIKINEIEFDNVKRLPNKYDLVITLGAKGASWNRKLYPTEKCEVFDVSGAGDTFLSAMAHQYLVDKSLDASIKFANKCARMVIQKFGTYVPTKEEIDDLRI